MPNKPKHEHSDRDRIFTPENLTKELIKKIPAELGDSWCDPCLGAGVFYNNFPVEKVDKYWYEIDKGRDFLQCLEEYDWCVTNIPFSLPKEFIFAMARCSKKGFGILCLANSMTASRLKKLEEIGFFIDSLTTLYVREWGFGYRTDFYVFTRQKKKEFETILI